MLRILGAYLAAVLVTYVGAAVAQTQSVMSSLSDMGVDVSVGDRLGATLHDVMGLAPLFLPMIALALAVAFPIAALIIRAQPWWRPVGYSLAGGAAVLAIHVVLYQAFSITPIAAARTTLGLTIQALCGAFGGWVFLSFLPTPARRPT